MGARETENRDREKERRGDKRRTIKRHRLHIVFCAADVDDHLFLPLVVLHRCLFRAALLAAALLKGVKSLLALHSCALS